MILIDTSVFIDMLQETKNEGTRLFNQVLDNGIPYGISVLTYQELFQGARNAEEDRYLQDYLNTLKIYHLPQDLDFYRQASLYRRTLRQSGITIRNTVDLLIATTAISSGLKLLHNDRDFDLMASKVSELLIYR